MNRIRNVCTCTHNVDKERTCVKRFVERKEAILTVASLFLIFFFEKKKKKSNKVDENRRIISRVIKHDFFCVGSNYCVVYCYSGKKRVLCSFLYTMSTCHVMLRRCAYSCFSIAFSRLSIFFLKMNSHVFFQCDNLTLSSTVAGWLLALLSANMLSPPSSFR